MAKRMLVIDDEQFVLQACRRVFTAEGYEVVVEPDGRKAKEMVLASFFDIILCDWQLTYNVDGLDLVEILDKRTTKSAIIMISGYPAIERATEAMRRGAVDYVAKPFTPEEIIEAVEKGLRYKSSQSPQ